MENSVPTPMPPTSPAGTCFGKSAAILGLAIQGLEMHETQRAHTMMEHAVFGHASTTTVLGPFG